MALVGPVTSALIGLISLGLSVLMGWSLMTEPATPLIAMAVWLGYINFALAVFNMIPGFPMDGGRVLRAIVWQLTGDSNRATRVASQTGQAIAFGFIILGVLRFFGGAGFGGLWIAFIGWFLLTSARASYAQVELQENLRGVHVGDLMVQDCATVDGNTNLQTFVEEYLLHTGQRCFLIAENGEVAGMITPHEIKGVERARWPFTLVSDAMRPLDRLRTVAPETPVIEALTIIGREDFNQLPVISNGRLVGMISRDQILRFLLTRSELKI